MKDFTVPTQHQGNQQLLRVCEVCGAYLSSRDSDERLAEHFAGKVHLGFLRIRSKINELRKILEEKGYDPDRSVLPPPRVRGPPGDTGYRPPPDRRSYDRDARRSRDHSRGSRSRDRYSRYDDRDRSREYRSSRDRSSRRSRDRDSYRSDRSRSRDRYRRRY